MNEPRNSPGRRRWGVLLLLALAAQGRAFAFQSGYEVEFSTAPIGTPFFRHLAFDLNVDLVDLEKFEKKGFGRAETITLILISRATEKPLKDYGKRRLKDKVSLRDLAKEAGLDYDTLEKNVQAIKQAIEAKGSTNLPPPIYATRKERDEEKDLAAGDNKKKKKGEPAPSPSPLATPAATPPGDSKHSDDVTY